MQVFLVIYYLFVYNILVSLKFIQSVKRIKFSDNKEQSYLSSRLVNTVKGSPSRQKHSACAQKNRGLKSTSETDEISLYIQPEKGFLYRLKVSKRGGLVVPFTKTCLRGLTNSLIPLANLISVCPKSKVNNKLVKTEVTREFAGRRVLDHKPLNIKLPDNKVEAVFFGCLTLFPVV